MIVIEARYIGKFKVPEWGTWHEWRKYHLYEEMRARENYNRFQRQFRGLYEFQMVKV
jgi:ribosomal protein S21